MDPKQLGERIRDRRKALGITQADLAQLSSCSIPSVIAAEEGKPTLRLHILIDLASVLGLKLELVDRVEEEG
jgi:transcriptional regulator with XRE-family HTH domain